MSQERLRKELWPGLAATLFLRRITHNRAIETIEEDGMYGRGGKGTTDEKDNDEISFSSAGPVVALGLTRLRLVEEGNAG